MRLYMMDQSPYARKARVVVHERGLRDRVEEIAVVPQDRPADLVALNPLSKVPVLVDDSGAVHVDSLPISLFLDGVGDRPPLLPADPARRAAVLSRHALANGLMECNGIRRIEGRLPPDDGRRAAIAKQEATTRRLLDFYDRSLADYTADFSLDTITLACALAHLDLRFPDEGWREGRPRLADWHAAVSERPSFRATAPKP